MKWLAPFVVLALYGASALAQQPTVDFSEALLNRVIRAVGIPQDAGVSQTYSFELVPNVFEYCTAIGSIRCPSLQAPPAGFPPDEIPLVACRKVGGGVVSLPAGVPVSWQWRIPNAYLTLTQNSMKFTATVVMRVGSEWSYETRTVDAALRFDPSTSRMKLDISRFTVELRQQNWRPTIGRPIDVAKLFAIALTLHPHAFSVALPNGDTRNINARVTGATPTYLPDLARVTLDVAM